MPADLSLSASKFESSRAIYSFTPRSVLYSAVVVGDDVVASPVVVSTCEVVDATPLVVVGSDVAGSA